MACDSTSNARHWLPILRIPSYSSSADPRNQRGYTYTAQFRVPDDLPSVADLTHSLPPCHDQRSLGGRTVNAIATGFQLDRGPTSDWWVIRKVIEKLEDSAEYEEIGHERHH